MAHRLLLYAGKTGRRCWSIEWNEQQTEPIMNAKNTNDLIARITSDAAFRKDLRANPEATLAREGIDASPELIAAIKGADADDLATMARDYENLPEHRKAAS